MPPPPPLITAIVVAELPALRRVDRSAPNAAAAPKGAAAVQPRFVLVLPHGDPSRLPKNVLPFCYPDLDQLARYPFAYENSAEEYTFTLTPKDEPRVHGFCRRYRLGSADTGGRLDLSPYTSVDVKEASQAPSYQCIAILSERPYARFFSQCLQLLHTARLAGGGVAMKVARALLQFNGAPAGSVLPLRSLVTSPHVPGHLRLPRERLRVPPAVGLPHVDVPLTPLLMRLDAPALLMLYTALLCERRVMFVASSLSTLTSCVHASCALLAPFEWQHIFIPVLSTPFLPYCCAPNPYLVGLTPPQFLALNDEYDIGEVVLVALDEGYVACLNGSAPLVDLEHTGPPSVPLGGGGGLAPPGSGYVSYAGPRLSAERALARVSGSSAVTGGASDSPVSGGRGDGGGFGSSGGGSDGADGSGGGGGGGMGGALLSGLGLGAAASLDVVLAPWHAFSRSHAYDDDTVAARAQRRAYMMRRVAARKAARDRVLRLYAKEPPLPPTAAAGSSHFAASPFLDDERQRQQHVGHAGAGGGVGGRRSGGEGGGSVAGGGDDGWGNADASFGGSGSGSGGVHPASQMTIGRATGGWGAVGPAELAAAAAAAAAAGGGPLSPPPISRPLAARNPAAVVTPGGADHVAMASRRRLSFAGGGGEAAAPGAPARGGASSGSGGSGSVQPIVSAAAAMLASLTGVTTEAALPTPDMELEGSIAAEYGAVTLPVDLACLSSRPPGDDGRRRRASRPRATLAPLAGGGAGGASGHDGDGGGSMLRRAAMQTMARAGKAVWSMATGAGGGGASTDCPAGRLAHEVRSAYARERREGCFDETHLTAAVVAFGACVFGRVTDFVTVEGTADLGGGHHHHAAHQRGAAAPLEPRFAKEEFVRLGLSVLAAATKAGGGGGGPGGAVGRLLDEVQHSQLLQAFACDAYLRQVATRSANGGTVGSSSSRGPPGAGALPVNVVDAAILEAAGGSGYHHAGQATFGSGGSGGSIGGGTYGSGSGGGGTGGSALLLAGPGAAASFTAVLRRTELALAGALAGGGAGVPEAPQADAAPTAYGTDRGVGGSAFTVGQALAGLAFAGGCVAAPPPGARGATPDAPPGVVVTALRALLCAATGPAHAPLPSPLEHHDGGIGSPASVLRVAVGASHDPALLPVVMGVLWARLNDCADRQWAQGHRALCLLDALLMQGSPRVHALALPFLPLLRFLLHPIRTYAVRAGFCAEELGGCGHTAGLVAAANVVWRGRAQRGLFGGGGSGGGAGGGAVPGLTLAAAPEPSAHSLSPRQGALLVARAAGRVYALLACPRRWLSERAVGACGPAGLSNGAPLALPLPYPLSGPHALSAPTAASCPPGWLPSQIAPHPPAMPAAPLSAPPSSGGSGGGGWGAAIDDGTRAGAAWIEGFAPSAPATPPASSSSPPPSLSHAHLGAPLVRQPRAVDAPWEQVHRVAMPPMASSTSAALASLAATSASLSLGAAIARPPYVAAAIAAARAEQSAQEAASGGGDASPTAAFGGSGGAPAAASLLFGGGSSPAGGASAASPVGHLQHSRCLSDALRAGSALQLPSLARSSGGGMVPPASSHASIPVSRQNNEAAAAARTQQQQQHQRQQSAPAQSAGGGAMAAPTAPPRHPPVVAAFFPEPLRSGPDAGFGATSAAHGAAAVSSTAAGAHDFDSWATTTGGAGGDGLAAGPPAARTPTFGNEMIGFGAGPPAASSAATTTIPAVAMAEGGSGEPPGSLPAPPLAAPPVSSSSSSGGGGGGAYRARGGSASGPSGGRKPTLSEIFLPPSDEGTTGRAAPASGASSVPAAAAAAPKPAAAAVAPPASAAALKGPPPDDLLLVSGGSRSGSGGASSSLADLSQLVFAPPAVTAPPAAAPPSQAAAPPPQAQAPAARKPPLAPSVLVAVPPSSAAAASGPPRPAAAAPAAAAAPPSDDPFAFDSFVLPAVPPHGSAAAAAKLELAAHMQPFGTNDFDSWAAPAAASASAAAPAAAGEPDPFAF